MVLTCFNIFESPFAAWQTKKKVKTRKRSLCRVGLGAARGRDGPAPGAEPSQPRALRWGKFPLGRSGRSGCKFFIVKKQSHLLGSFCCSTIHFKYLVFIFCFLRRRATSPMIVRVFGSLS